MLREQISAALKTSIKSKEACATATLRLISAAIKDRDIAARDKGNQEGISDDEILSLLQSMIKQRVESADIYDKGDRQDLAAREREEITVIERFLPAQMSADEVVAAVEGAIKDTGADCIKDMGKCMAALKQKYAGRMDFSKASALVKDKLC
ncbi:MAG TPA: glutamyl-tRNA amidotransferase [Rhodospirillaceae bacterium]|nr:glutamyl-tRNA amidotransferase [Magnetovibrio sp.]UTW52136.1 GatB/YqeY domain-containing protein [bacterium SCSIO 12827]HCS72123.1 glutamyl-tRNA amidotransferase [Rhodospirillaceae bacterium]|tara:strand:+ start:2855 stop:3310 length:456 start_codon:yes stop_codon:yes gene_type:complete